MALRPRFNPQNAPKKFHLASFIYGAIAPTILVAVILLRPTVPTGVGTAGRTPTTAASSTSSTQTDSWDQAVEVAWQKLKDEGLQQHPYADVCETFGLTHHPMTYYCQKTKLSPTMITRGELTDIAIYAIAGIAHEPEGTPLKEAIHAGIDELLRRKPIPQDSIDTRQGQALRALESKSQADAYRARHQARTPE